MRIRLKSAGFVACALMLWTAAALSQDDFPNRPIRLITPAAQGGTTDILARLFGARMAESFKQQQNAVEKALERMKAHAEGSEPIELFARLDGKDISGRYLMLEALNLRYVGPNLHLASESQPGDGTLDVILVTEAERDRLLYYLAHWQENRDRLAVLPTLRGRKFELEWSGFPLHIDDKLKPSPKAKPKEIAGPVEARLDGDTVEFLVPVK